MNAVDLESIFSGVCSTTPHVVKAAEECFVIVDLERS